MSYEDWDVQKLPTDRLKLDPENPRVLRPQSELTQRDLFEELIESEDVHSLAKDIAEEGYYPTEVMIAYLDEGNDEYYVAEGNRRLASLRLLKNPDLAPARHRSKFQKLSKKAAGLLPKKVLVAVAPSRSAAEPIILSRHTRESVKKWTPFMQARFVERLMLAGDDAESVGSRLDLSKEVILKRYRMAKLYRLATSIKLPDDVESVVKDPRKFKLTNLARLAEFAAGAKWLGIEKNDKHGFVVKSKPAEFKRAIAKIVTDMVSGVNGEKLDSRKINDEKSAIAYLKTLSGIKPKLGSGRSVAMDKVSGVKGQSRTPKTGPADSPRKSGKRRTTLMPAGMEVTANNPRIHSLFKQLNTCNAEKYIDLWAMGLRALIEMATAHYLDRSKKVQLATTWWANKKKKPASALGNKGLSLYWMLHWMATQDQNSDLNSSARQALQKFINDRNGPLSLDTMHWFVHNRYISPTTEELKALMATLQPLLEVVLKEPA